MIKAKDAFKLILELSLRWVYPNQTFRMIDDLVIRIVDRTSVRTQGKAREYRIHAQCDLPLRRIEQIQVTDNHTAEALTLYNFGEESLVLADSGYARTKQLEAIYNKADFLLRFSPYSICFWRGKEKIDFYSLLKDRDEAFQFPAQIKKNGALVRIVALPIPEEAWEKIRERKQEAARKRQTKTPDPRREVFSHWTLLVTSLPYRVSMAEIGKLYSLRWQIEILFRDMKGSLDLQHIKRCTDAFAEVILTLKLIAWLLAQYVLHKLTLTLPDREVSRMSSGVLMKELLLWLQQAIRAALPHDTSLSHPNSLRRLLDHKRLHPPRFAHSSP